jgi:hypothetical protein
MCNKRGRGDECTMPSEISLTAITGATNELSLQGDSGVVMPLNSPPNHNSFCIPLIIPTPNMCVGCCLGTNVSIDLVVWLNLLTCLHWLDPNSTTTEHSCQLFSAWRSLNFLDGGDMKSFLTDVTGSSSWYYRNQLWGHDSEETRHDSTKEHYLIEEAELSLHLWISISFFILSK